MWGMELWEKAIGFWEERLVCEKGVKTV